MSGFDRDPETLKAIKRELQDAASALDGASKDKAPPVDAGVSTEAASAVMTNLIKMSAATAQIFDDTADKVHVANGSYDEIENDNEEGLKKYRELGLPSGEYTEPKRSWKTHDDTIRENEAQQTRDLLGGSDDEKPQSNSDKLSEEGKEKVLRKGAM